MSQLRFIPVDYVASSLSYFKQVYKETAAIWLDSGKPNSTYGRFDIITSTPVSLHSYNPNLNTISSTSFLNSIEQALKSHFDEVNTSAPSDYQPPFIGGAIGYLNYDLNHDEIKLPRTNTRACAEVGIYDWALVQDHKLQQAYCIFHPRWTEVDIEAQLLKLKQAGSEKNLPTFSIDAWKEATSKAEYLKSVNAIKNYISAGDAYQVNYSQEFSANYTGSELDGYIKMRETVPSPYSACLLFPSVSVLSVSPEKFVSIKGGQAVTRPIKGTMARGKTKEEDALLAEELQSSVKNRAENLMIVDLLRNDFSKNCEPHSVRTPSLFALESFENVHHLVSTVRGTLSSGVSPLSFIRDCFPGGSITGAPKYRSMEIINELEPHNRGIYCGSIFYLSANGQLDSSITIRTAHLENGKISCCGGGGIVADSDAEAEYEESLQKISSFLNILK